MSKVYMMVTITNRNIGPKMLSFYKENELAVNLNMLGAGTANSDMLDYFGLEATEKAVMFAVVRREMWRKLKRGLQKKMHIDVPGTGIAFIIPFSSIGGKKALQFLTDRQDFEKEEESILKETEYELIVVILNQGYSNLVMDAAREKGAPEQIKGKKRHYESNHGESGDGQQSKIYCIFPSGNEYGGAASAGGRYIRGNMRSSCFIWRMKAG